MAEPIETREQAIEYLFSRVNYEWTPARRTAVGSFKLDRMRRLLELLGNPQQRLPVVHIAGTKGKGSTAVMIASVLTAAGYRTGLFTSPHVSAFEERMRVDGVEPNEQQLVELVNAVAGPVAEMERASDRMRATYFEIATAMAWLFFTRQETELVVLEVGLGGRLDATNICAPLATVITNISRDHTAVLGNRISQIAREKAGIVKPGVPVISGIENNEARHVVEEVCREKNAHLYLIGREIRVDSQFENQHAECRRRVEVVTPWRTWSAVPLSLAGQHQASNAALALAVLDLLGEGGRPVPRNAVDVAMGGLRWPVRIEVVSQQPTVIVDAAHNSASIAALLRTLDEEFSARRRILVFAATRDKDVAGLLEQLAPKFDAIVLTRYRNNPRSVPVEHLHRAWRAISKRRVFQTADPADAWKLARQSANPDDLICVTGSFFIAAEIRKLILNDLDKTLPEVRSQVALQTQPTGS